MEERTIWGILSLFRVMWCLAPQKAYLHPDEFFQSPEVMAGDILDLDINRPWEFRTDFPCRSVLFPLLTSGTAFWILEILNRMGFDNALSCSYILLVLPRLLITLLSFILDYTVYQIAPLYATTRWKALVLLAASHVTLVFYTRTISNAIEGILFALLLLLTSPACNITSNFRKAKDYHFIGMVLAAGFFNRPTFLCFALMPVLYWGLQNGVPQFSYKSVALKVFKLLPSALVTSGIFIVADTLYYTGNYPFYINNIKHYTHHPRQNIILTPLNFLLYNLNTSNLAQHGVHPSITHLAVNGPMLFGLLHVSIIHAGFAFLKRDIWPKSHSPTTQCERSSQHKAKLLSFYFVPLTALSFINHQEPRFLIPLVLPLVLLLSNHKRTRKIKCVIVVFNVLGAIFFGCLHQAGLIPSLFHIQKIVQAKSAGNMSYHHTILFTHTYMPPHYLLSLKKGQAAVDILDLAGFQVDHLCQRLQDIQKDLTLRSTQELENKRHDFIVVFPGTISPVIDHCGLVYKSHIWFMPHLSMEDPPKISHLLKGDLISQLALHVIEVNVPIIR